MIGKVLGYLGMLVVAGVLAQTTVTTYYLAKIDAGLHSSLQSTTDLIQIQNTIVHKNQALQGVVLTTQEMSKRLDATLKLTQIVDMHIHSIDALNADTLTINRGLVTIGDNSGQILSKVSTNTGALAQTTQDLSHSMGQLDRLIEEDRANMDQMKAYADQMNQKTPGVTG